MKWYFSLVFIVVSVSNITACGSIQKDPSVRAVESYINALVNKDSATLSSVSCADWESDALNDLDSFQAVTTKLEGLNCSVIMTEDTITHVNCTGKIIATYNNEDLEIDLSVRNYQVLHQGSDYLVCGYQ